MKRIVILLIALLLAALPAFAADAPFSTFDYKTGQAGGGRYLYYDFPDISILLPIEWKDRFTVEQSDSGVAFYQTASQEQYAQEGIHTGGFLFELCASADEGFRDLPAYEYLGYSENAGLHFYLLLPSDYPAWPDDAIRAEYDQMAADIGTVVEKARIAPSLSFYTEGIESTDPGMS